MASLVLQTAAAWRAKYIGKATSSSSSSSTPRKAVVVGATSGIGRAISHRLAEQGWAVVAVGRHREGRDEAIVQALRDCSPDNSNAPAEHAFVGCDCFSLANVRTVATEILSSHGTIDALVVSQGMATTQGFTPTPEGNDEKLTLHYFSRIAFGGLLLPALRKSTMPRGPVVLSVLSGGVHGPYAHYQEDFSLQHNYSIKNAADAAGYYNDLGFDKLARTHGGINFVHAAPGFVNTNWGTEFHPVLRTLVRCLQPLGRSASDCAEFLLGPTVLASAHDEDLAPRSRTGGVIILGDKGQAWNLTDRHTDEAMASVWKSTVEVLEKAGIDIDAA